MNEAKYAELERGASVPTKGELRERLDELARMPALLARAVASRNDAARRARPEPDAFSLHEHVWYLRDIEVQGYARRLRALANEREPFLADLDGTRLAAERRYLELPLERGLAEFVAARESNLAFARSLPHDALRRRGELEGVGCITLAELIELWRNHDAGHADEIAALA
ncbi:MAG: hypothetical protein K8S98_12195 [Planctomycetes bacterium]|nr:hypothetical protein [Planctomycetota bacterium]